jgi:hypothetical protein
MTRLSQLSNPHEFELEHERETLRERRDRRLRRNLKCVAACILVLAFSAASLVTAFHGSVPLLAVRLWQ